MERSGVRNLYISLEQFLNQISRYARNDSILYFAEVCNANKNRRKIYVINHYSFSASFSNRSLDRGNDFYGGGFLSVNWSNQPTAGRKRTVGCRQTLHHYCLELYSDITNYWIIENLLRLVIRYRFNCRYYVTGKTSVDCGGNHCKYYHYFRGGSEADLSFSETWRASNTCIPQKSATNKCAFWNKYDHWSVNFIAYDFVAGVRIAFLERK
ncbi:MAG: hypothetical protein JSW07_10295 [bacterium]|nr:MAG: hypothetical protein JSW07_10295 [bacterium]